MSLDRFVVGLIRASKVRVATLSYALIVLDRLKEKLPPLAQGMHCTRHRIFLAALVVSSKYLNDSTPKNKHWTQWLGNLFDTCEITLMEKQMLGLLDFDLRVTEAQLVARLSPLIHPSPAQTSKIRQEVVKKILVRHVLDAFSAAVVTLEGLSQSTVIFYIIQISNPRHNARSRLSVAKSVQSRDSRVPVDAAATPQPAFSHRQL
jgi:hypothetical protein